MSVAGGHGFHPHRGIIARPAEVELAVNISMDSMSNWWLVQGCSARCGSIQADFAIFEDVGEGSAGRRKSLDLIQGRWRRHEKGDRSPQSPSRLIHELLGFRFGSNGLVSVYCWCRLSINFFLVWWDFVFVITIRFTKQTPKSKHETAERNKRYQNPSLWPADVIEAKYCYEKAPK